MALFYDRVAFTTTTTGTGTVNVGNALTAAFMTPAEAGVTNGASPIPYLILDGDNFEIGVGTYATGTPPTFARTTVHVSKISGTVGTSKINLSGSAVVRFGFGATELGEIATKVADVDGKVSKAGDTGLGGFTSAGHNLGTLSGTVTPVPTATSNFKYGTNSGAFTLAAPTTAGYYTIAILVTNAGSGAGALTATGFDKVHGTFSTDANKKQILTIEVFGSVKVLTIREAS